uniref:Oxidative stress-responsive serine-rich protein 1 n=1 Tax=Periophthalmus magnuspinnatus TaxID=409849 RepID=A0A3B4AEG1_9GOBI
MDRAGGKECEEETLQTAFKKLRVDAESLSGAVSASEAVTQRSASRACLDTNGAKPKLVCQKDNWHGCTRKTSRGASRTQRRRRSKSPILQPPKFTYCSSPPEPGPLGEGETLSSVAQKEPSSSHAQSHISALIFGTSAAYDTAPAASASSLQETVPAIKVSGDVQTSEESRAERSACDGAESGARLAQAQASDFRVLSELSSSCCCCLPNNPTSWNDVEVYSFTGLRNVVTECERATLSPEDSQRTVSTNSNLSATTSGSPRSCSEQARAYVDDITIEDLSGYLEYYLYIPKKMSHMAEMMYT